jgi:hypothetical protein
LYTRPGVQTCQYIETSLNENSIYLSNIKLFPSPVSDILKINLDNYYRIVKIKFTDILGQIISVSQLTLDKNFYEYDFSLLKEGIYFAIISTDQGNRTFKIVKD